MSLGARPRVGVSSCLLGQRVRYDGVLKGLPWAEDELARAVELVPICPEVGAGMSVPRPAIALVERANGLRLELVEGTRDVSLAMREYCDSVLLQLEKNELHGFLFKARSPSCGVRDTPHFSASGDVVRRGSGMWAQLIHEHWPLLPLADEGDVQNELGRAEFLRRVHACWAVAKHKDSWS